jgi:DNA-cytosine methyltransferase
MKPLRVLSLFDGVSAGLVALKRANIPVDVYYASEIEQGAIKVAMQNHPEIIQLGSVVDWKSWDLGEIDLIIGGSPCQGFSYSGKRLNFSDPRSALFFTYTDILATLKPKWFFLENVVMKKEWEDTISSYMGVSPILINSSLVSAQNRRRLYWTNIPNVGQPEDKHITWGDVREHGVDQAHYYYSEKAMQWLAKHSRRKGKTLTVHSDRDKMQMLEASHAKSYSSQRFFGIVDAPPTKQQRTEMRSNRISRMGSWDERCVDKSEYLEIKWDEGLNKLVTVDGKGVELPFTKVGSPATKPRFFRYITVVECCRLQTFPDNYFDGCPKTVAYRALGNSWTVDVIVHFFQNLASGDITKPSKPKRTLFDNLK